MTTDGHDTHDGVNLTLFMHSEARHAGMPMHDWLLKRAHKEGLAGGSVFRAIAGIGRHGVLHDESFFELAGDLPLRVEFVLSADEADRMLELLREAGVDLVYTLAPVTYGVLTKQQSK